MLLEGLLSSGAVGVLEQVMSFTQARHQVLVDNVSNFDTVGRQMKDLPTEEFFKALGEAVERRDRGGAGARLQPGNTRHYRWGPEGQLEAKATILPDNNILFHDGNNRFVEKQISEMTQNTILHNLTAEMLRAKYEGLNTAIRGNV